MYTVMYRLNRLTKKKGKFAKLVIKNIEGGMLEYDAVIAAAQALSQK